MKQNLMVFPVGKTPTGVYISLADSLGTYWQPEAIILEPGQQLVIKHSKGAVWFVRHSRSKRVAREA